MGKHRERKRNYDSKNENEIFHNNVHPIQRNEADKERLRVATVDDVKIFFQVVSVIRDIFK